MDEPYVRTKQAIQGDIRDQHEQQDITTNN
jgi:hypothetical protein